LFFNKKRRHISAQAANVPHQWAEVPSLKDLEYHILLAGLWCSGVVNFGLAQPFFISFIPFLLPLIPGVV